MIVESAEFSTTTKNDNNNDDLVNSEQFKVYKIALFKWFFPLSPSLSRDSLPFEFGFGMITSFIPGKLISR